MKTAEKKIMHLPLRDLEWSEWQIEVIVSEFFHEPKWVDREFFLNKSLSDLCQLSGLSTQRIEKAITSIDSAPKTHMIARDEFEDTYDFYFYKDDLIPGFPVQAEVWGYQEPDRRSKKSRFLFCDLDKCWNFSAAMSFIQAGYVHSFFISS